MTDAKTITQNKLKGDMLPFQLVGHPCACVRVIYLYFLTCEGV